MSGRAGYWDVDACAWVGAEPMYVGPPAPADDTSIPAPRADADADADVDAPAAPLT
jgi:hypothetical protein